jgi:predicted AlkP superfamily pyrophosphatase or phosphodiesterase
MRQPRIVATALVALTFVLTPPTALEAKRAPKPSVGQKTATKQAWPPNAPRLIVAISVDQFSADEFTQFRRFYSAGLAKLQRGAVFPQGYQSHAATETCPGHSTMMTGDHPERTGIIANNWYGARPGSPMAKIYCAEDETNPESSPAKPVVSARHLLVPTLGERVKAVDPKSLNVSVSGKDRAAVMMGGHVIDAAYWWDGNRFTTFADRRNSPAADAENAAVDTLLKSGAPAYDVPEFCKARDAALVLRKDVTIGTYKFPLAQDTANPDQEKIDFRVSPRFDEATGDLALKLVDELKLGADSSPDVLSVSFSANDYIGHAYGTQGVEMCIQQAALDRTIGKLLDGLDARGIDYVVVLTADHGMIDAPERNNLFAYPGAMRASGDTSPAMLSQRIASELGLTRDLPIR